MGPVLNSRPAFARVCEHGRVTAQKATGLTPDDLDTLATGIAAGKRMTVYLRDPLPSLALDAGTSARVVSIDGSTVTVSPKGVDDQLPFEANELQRSRATTPSASARRKSSQPPPAPSPPPTPAPATSPSKAPAARQTRSSARPAPNAESLAKTTAETPTPTPAKATRRPKPSTAAISVVISSAAESAWTVAVSHGSKKLGKPTEVTADRVARAMRELGDGTAISAVDGMIDAAREAAQKKIDDLSRELETARAALATLEGRSDHE
ncbi:DUF6319 family protein [Gordonia sp. ABSL11-1]|uniref:DUF6319 family protein n=1 Tax=Gordonia sp. ABSL11-1 TaxID=3053924 RepID=UPI002573C12E|nr:DUF6319 family protein [Gordonia sp. ABSL11-1]MDL9946245.1 DUF6319 family protein [Gordonia sp. ABSL11-1]